MAVHSDIYMNFLFQMIACFSLVIIIFIPQKKFFHIDFLDVGQGDGIYVEAEDGTAIFIDGGSTSVNEVGRYRILPYLKYHGIRKINYWYVSHTDEDHISGLREALEAEYPISNIIFSYKVEQNENWQGIVNLAEEKGVPVSYIKAGDRLVCGNVNSKGVNGESSKKNSSACMTLTAVFPDENSSFEGANENSLVLLLNYDNFDAMLTGDIGAEQEQYIAENDLLGINDKNTTLDGKIEVLKIAHHGSKNSSDSEFLTYISADTAIISCAKKNNYGHPAREAVERIEEVGYIIRYTMEEGQIRVN